MPRPSSSVCAHDLGHRERVFDASAIEQEVDVRAEDVLDGVEESKT
jgi:hypothetical protein